MINLHITPGHPIDQIIRNISNGIHTRRQVTNNFCLFLNFVSLIDPKKISEDLKDAYWIKVMQYDLNEFERHEVWSRVPRLENKTIIETCSVFHNKMD